MRRRKNVSSGSPWEPRLGFSRAVRMGDAVSVAGTAPLGDDGETVAPGDAAAQARRCLEIVRDALHGLDANLSDVVRTRIILKRIEDWESVGEVHGEFFGEIRPATTVMQIVSFADPEWLVEIEADAVASE